MEYIDFVKVLRRGTTCDYEALLAFGYFLSNQSDSAYNLSYYMSRRESFIKCRTALLEKISIYQDCCAYAANYMKYINLQNVEIKVFIDDVCVLLNIDKGQVDNVIDQWGVWVLTISGSDNNGSNLKSVLSNKIYLKIKIAESSISPIEEDHTEVTKKIREVAMVIDLSKLKTNSERLLYILRYVIPKRK